MTSVRKIVTVFMLAGLGAFVLCGVGLAVAQREAATKEAIRDARRGATIQATGVVEPALPDDLSRAASFEQLDRVVRERVLSAQIVHVNLWDPAGRVLYSNQRQLIGQRLGLPPSAEQVLRTGEAVAEVGDPSEPRNAEQADVGEFLEVFVGVQTASGQPLVLETHQPYKEIQSIGRQVWLTTLPSLIVGLLLLYLVKAVMAYRMAKELTDAQEEREQLLVAALAAADRERMQIASDLHDGVVQGLAGASFTLSEAAASARAADQVELADAVGPIATSLRHWVRELRSLIVTVTPPALHGQGLEATLTDLVATLQAREIRVQLDVADVDGLPEQIESLVYRVAQEVVRNVIRHAHASHVQLVISRRDGWLEMLVTDDGTGFAPSVSPRRQGSVGLELLAGLAATQRGVLGVESEEGRGTTVTLRVPVGLVQPSGASAHQRSSRS